MAREEEEVSSKGMVTNSNKVLEVIMADKATMVVQTIHKVDREEQVDIIR